VSKVLIVAGEASGDFHASRLIGAFKQLRPEAEVYGVGGPAMRDAGVRIIRDISGLMTFGVSEVIRHIPNIVVAFLKVLGGISRERPDVVVLVDYPDFNMWLARAIRWRYGKKPLILYYITPQVWIWRKYRARVLARLADRLAVVLPFEKEFFADLGAKVHFVGHPLLDIEKEGEAARNPMPNDDIGRKIALLPGSRVEELKNYMPHIMEAVRLLKESGGDWRFFIVKAPTLDESDFSPYLGDSSSGVKIVSGSTQKLIEGAEFAVVAMGTATLETALAGAPALLIGKVSLLTYLLGIYLMKMDFEYYSLVNFILKRPAFPELIQDNISGGNIAQTVMDITSNEHAMEALRKAAAEVRERLEVEPGKETKGNTASQRTAAILDEMVMESHR